MTLSPKVFGVTTKPTDPTPAVGQQTFFAPECVTPVTYPWLNEFIQIFLNSQTYLGITNTPNDDNALKKMFEKILEGLIATGANTPRKLIDRFADYLSASDFGAVGDGIANDTVKFDILETLITGKAIDLQGKTYLVDAMPIKNEYINGAFKVGSEIYVQHKNPSNHPFERPAPHIKNLFPVKNNYVGLSNVLWHNPDDGKMGIMYRDAIGHGDDEGSIIRFCLSDDAFNSVSPVPSAEFPIPFPAIYSDDNYDYRNCAGGRLPNGRIFSVWTAATTEGVYGNPIRVYSDNIDEVDTNDITWTVDDFTVTPTALDFHGDVLNYPASVGGHDTNGLIFYGYSTTHGICAYSSTDGGATLTEHLNIVNINPAGDVDVVSEIHVCRIADEDKWVMLIRNSGANTFAAMSVSDDMINWSVPVLTPLLLGSSSPAIFYESGSLWAVAFNRRNNATDLDYKNSLKISKGDPDEVFNSGGASGWQGWNDVCYLPFWASGYFHHIKVENKNYGIFSCENNAGSTASQQSYLSMISCDPTSVPSIKEIYRMIPNKNMFPQGGMQHWPAGTSIATGADRKVVIPRMTAGRGGTGTGGTISRSAGKRETAYDMRIRRDNGDTSTSPIVLVVNFPVDECLPFRDDKIGYVTVSFWAKCSSGYSASNKFFSVRCRQHSTGSEQIITLDAGTYTTGDTVVQSANTGVFLKEIWQKYEMTIGRFAVDMTQFCVEFYWTPTGTASEDFVEMSSIKIEQGQVATPFEVERLTDVINDSDRYYQAFSVSVGTDKLNIGFGCEMARVPDITDSLGATINGISKRGFNILHTGSGTTDIIVNANL